MLSFVENSPTAYHAVENIKNMLTAAGYIELSESDKFNISAGGKYYVTRNGSSIIAFSLPEKAENTLFRIIAAHTDSPSFKIKNKPQVKGAGKYAKLNVEGYGGMICHSWMDRPLSVAGRIFYEEGGEVQSALFDFEKDFCLIPNVAIHMNREVNDGYKFNKQIDMLPIFSMNYDEDSFYEAVAKKANIERKVLLAADLFLYNRDKAVRWGLKDEFISAPRLDDLECVYAAVESHVEGAKDSKYINICACFDNEEVGSLTMQGASSTFLKDVMKRIACALKIDEEGYMQAISRSFMLSADNAHAVHPNHPEHTDENNCVHINEGIVLKSHAGGKYTSDGEGIAAIKLLAERAGVPVQYFSNRSDKAGGSTLGNLVQAQVSVKTVDIGLPQLAMHSAYETAGAEDIVYMKRLMTEFYKL